MRPLILMPTINSRNSNACYLQLLSVHRDASTPHRQSAPAGGGRGLRELVGDLVVDAEEAP